MPRSCCPDARRPVELPCRGTQTPVAAPGPLETYSTLNRTYRGVHTDTKGLEGHRPTGGSPRLQASKVQQEVQRLAGSGVYHLEGGVGVAVALQRQRLEGRVTSTRWPRAGPPLLETWNDSTP